MAPVLQSANPEDVEAELVVQEMDREMWEQFKVAERVVASRLDSEGDEEYLVKWKGAGYDLCTWEKPNGVHGSAHMFGHPFPPTHTFRGKWILLLASSGPHMTSFFCMQTWWTINS